MLTKRLKKIGNSRGIVLDRAILQLLGIDDDSELKLEVMGNKLIIEKFEGAKPVTNVDEALDSIWKN